MAPHHPIAAEPPPYRRRLLRLAILGQSPCHLCVAACCKQNGHAYAVLLEGDERRRFAAWSVSAQITDGVRVNHERVIPYRDSRCPFPPYDLCTIYEDRPVNCRRFQCVAAYHRGGTDLSGHGEFLNRNPTVLVMLEAL